MVKKIEVTINIIVHATENISKFFESFEEMFGFKEEIFTIQQMTGHFGNPITMIKGKIIKKDALKFVEKLVKLLSDEQKNEIMQEIQERTIDSTLHIRLDKQKMIKGKLSFKEGDAVKLKIYTPVYNKKNIVKSFSEILKPTRINMNDEET